MRLIYTQYCLRNIKDNNNFESNVLIDVDLFIASLYITMYSRVMLDFILETVNLWRKIEKQTLTK